MSDISEYLHEPEPFRFYPFDGTPIEQEAFELIKEGLLPREIMFKLAQFGFLEGDPETGKRRSWAILRNLIDTARSPDAMREDTRALLDGDMPDAIIDWNLGTNKSARTGFEHMYYSVGNLATVIHENAGESDVDPEFRRQISRTVAKGLWRVMVTRHHPEWLQNPNRYYVPSVYHSTVYDGVSPRTMQRRIIRYAVLSDPLVHSTFTEAQTTGVRGIGKKGIESLRFLLQDEHPELL